MAEKAEIGKYYIVTKDRIEKIGSIFWSYRADKYVDGIPRKCIAHFESVSSSTDPYKDWCELEGATSDTRLWFHPGFLDEVAAPQAILDQCKCPLWRGCSCGVFKREMEASKKKFNPVLGLWEEPIPTHSPKR